MLAPDAAIIDEPAIFKTLEQATPDAVAVREVLAKARQLNGLEAAEVAVLMNVSDPELLGELFAAARDVKDTIYGVTHGHGEIRRVNVNVAPLTDDEFRALSERSIGTYQLFQETDHHQTYASVHLGGKKRDYEWRVTAMDRAIESGIHDVGIGVLFGLYDWRFELLALLQHIRRERFALGVSQISAGSRTNPGG